MKTKVEDRPVSDEFEPIELGSVSEETKGGDQPDTENATGTFNSKQL